MFPDLHLILMQVDLFIYDHGRMYDRAMKLVALCFATNSLSICSYREYFSHFLHLPSTYWASSNLFSDLGPASEAGSTMPTR